MEADSRGRRPCLLHTSVTLKKRVDNPPSVMSANRFTSPMLSRHGAWPLPLVLQHGRRDSGREKMAQALQRFAGLEEPGALPKAAE